MCGDDEFPTATQIDVISGPCRGRIFRFWLVLDAPLWTERWFSRGNF